MYLRGRHIHHSGTPDRCLRIMLDQGAEQSVRVAYLINQTRVRSDRASFPYGPQQARVRAATNYRGINN